MRFDGSEMRNVFARSVKEHAFLERCDGVKRVRIFVAQPCDEGIDFSHSPTRITQNGNLHQGFTLVGCQIHVTSFPSWDAGSKGGGATFDAIAAAIRSADSS